MRCISLALALAFAAQCMAAESYPLKISANKRYLVDQAGKPFLIHGDSPWSLFTAWSYSDAAEYLADRKAKGFNTLLVNILDDTWKHEADGTKPFLSGADFSTPNEKYFQHVDRVMKLAQEQGFLMLVVPVYIGCCEIGWKEELHANGPAKAREFGRYIGRRYGKYTNVIWTIGGDRNPDRALPHNPGGYREALNQLALGIKEHSGSQLFTVHTDHNASGIEQYPRETWMDVNNIYTYHPEENLDPHVYVWADREYARKHRLMPFFLIESSYEDDGRRGQKDQMIRRQVFWAMLSGACGHLFGNGKLWGGAPGWKQALNMPGSLDMQRIRTFLEPLPWWDLLPDTEHQFLTWGYGEYTKSNYAVAAVSSDKKLGLVYVPGQRKVSVDLAKLSGPVQARWWNPANGKWTEVPAAETNRGGVVELQSPAPEDIFSSDAVLIVTVK